MIPSSTRHPPFRRYPPFNQYYHHQQQPCQTKTRLFTVKLLSNHHQTHLFAASSSLSVDSLVADCNPKPYKSYIRQSGTNVASLSFQRQADALAAFVAFWDRRLAGDHVLTPVVDFTLPDEVVERVRVLFRLYVENNVLQGEAVKRLERRVNELASEIDKFSRLLRKPKGVREFNEIEGRKKRLVEEMDGTVKRVEEFRRGVKCVVDYLEGKKEGEEFAVLGFKNGGKGFVNWSRIHYLLLRECRRVEDGLPIYGFRREILQQVRSQQVLLVLLKMNLFF